jgi:hypothetical protein
MSPQIGYVATLGLTQSTHLGACMQLATHAVAGVWPLYAVVVHGDGRSVVLGHEEGAAVVAKIVLKRMPRHRSDVDVSDIADLDAMALPGGVYLIRTANTYRQTQGVQVGMCPRSVISAIQVAVRRNRDGIAMESKYRPPDLALV